MEKRSICFGGACFVDKETLIKVGMQNENFISWGSEDDEIHERFKKFGLKIVRTNSSLLHLYHSRNIDSGQNNFNYKNNILEFNKIKEMNKKETKEYIKSWPWLKNV